MSPLHSQFWCNKAARLERSRLNSFRRRDLENSFGIQASVIILWRTRFAQQRLDGLWEIAPGRGRSPPTASTNRRHRGRDLANQAGAMTHCSCRTILKVRESVSPPSATSGGPIWPHRVRPHYRATPPREMTDVIGLYFAASDRLCVDEKSQIQALDRPNPPGRGDDPHYAQRITTLFAALKHSTGSRHGALATTIITGLRSKPQTLRPIESAVDVVVPPPFQGPAPTRLRGARRRIEQTGQSARKNSDKTYTQSTKSCRRRGS